MSEREPYQELPESWVICANCNEESEGEINAKVRELENNRLLNAVIDGTLADFKDKILSHSICMYHYAEQQKIIDDIKKNKVLDTEDGRK